VRNMASTALPAAISCRPRGMKMLVEGSVWARP
jgi:hypothetical protein